MVKKMNIKALCAALALSFCGVSAMAAPCGTTGQIQTNGGSGHCAAVAAPSGAVVGTTDTQTLTNKIVGNYPQVFNVKTPYGATGNGSTDDTAAINSAIAALNAAGGGKLSFPPGNYYSAACNFTTISSAFIVEGTGFASRDGTQYGSLITCGSSSNNLFTVSAKVGLFTNIGMLNNSGTTPTAGAAIEVTSSYFSQRINYDGVSVSGFFDGIDQFVGESWTLRASYIINPVRYAVYIQNTVNADAGDWVIDGNSFYAGNNTSQTTSAAIYQASSGGGKITNNKVNSGGADFVNGYLGNLSGSEQLLITGNDIENTLRSPIEVTAGWPFVTIVGNYFNPACYAAIDLVTTSYFIIGDNTFGTVCGSPVAYAINTHASSSGTIGVNNYGLIGTYFTNTATYSGTGVYDYSSGIYPVQDTINIGSTVNADANAIANFWNNYGGTTYHNSIQVSWPSYSMRINAIRALAGQGFEWRDTGGSLIAYIDSVSGSIHSGKSGSYAGCLALYATDNNSTLMYETVTTGGTVTWTSTKPANCN